MSAIVFDLLFFLEKNSRKYTGISDIPQITPHFGMRRSWTTLWTRGLFIRF